MSGSIVSGEYQADRRPSSELVGLALMASEVSVLLSGFSRVVMQEHDVPEALVNRIELAVCELHSKILEVEKVCIQTI